MSAFEHEMTDSEYEDYLNEIYGDVEICGQWFSSGRALRKLDEIAFNCSKSELTQWKCSECGDVYSDESEAEECWKTCCDVIDCDKCGDEVIIDDAVYSKEFDEYYCSEKCRKEMDDIYNSHLGDED